ncbi:MAG: ribosome-binding factor A [Parcubacteria group bacterium]|nr:ribosome-binding factor A [Parcubacteria group bacterium]
MARRNKKEKPKKTGPSKRVQKAGSALQKIVAEFVESHAPKNTLLTVTDVAVSPDLRYIVVFVSVYPDVGDVSAAKLLNEERRGLNELLSKQAEFKYMPKVVFEIDRGEKNRQRIDELLEEK